MQHILLVDDLKDALAMLQCAVQAAFGPLPCTLARSVREALDVLERAGQDGTAFDLALVDLALGDGSGLEVLDFMRAQPRLAEVPVLVVSAAADQDLLAEARARGAQACLLKPVDLQQLRQMALSLLGEVV